MKKCADCGGRRIELSDKTKDGILYNYYKCTKCGEEVLSMSQLHKVAEKYRAMKRYRAKISRWGTSLGIRIPKELTEEYKLKDSGSVYIIPDKNSLKIIPV